MEVLIILLIILIIFLIDCNKKIINSDSFKKIENNQDKIFDNEQDKIEENNQDKIFDNEQDKIEENNQDKIFDNEQDKIFEYTFIIYTTNIGLLIAESLGHMLIKLNFTYRIVLEITIDDINENRKNPHEIYIILFPQTLKNFPDVNKYIIYQLEQYKQSKWINDEYKKKIENSIFTWEYSLENYNNFEPKYKKKIFYLPVPIIKIVHDNKPTTYKYDLIFVGAPNKRRTDIIRELKKRYKVLFLTKTFNNDLYDKMEQSKIILNLHYYKNAILETTRINEALFNNKLVISEEPDEYDYFNKNMYEQNVVFIDEIKDDLSNIKFLYKNIDKYLDNNRYNSKIIENNDFINKIYEFSFYFFYKSLYKNNLIKTNINYNFKNINLIIKEKMKYIKNIIVITSNFIFNNKEDQEINDLNKIIKKDYFDWYYFTNINTKISGWDILNGNYYDVQKYNLNDKVKNYFYKTQALKIDLLSKYSYIISIDDTLKINNYNFIIDIIDLLEKHNEDLFLINSDYTINEDIINNLEVSDDIKNILLKQYNDYKLIIKDKKIYNTKFFIYKNNETIKNIFNKWWDECIKYNFKLNISLALSYIIYKYNINTVSIPIEIISKNNQNDEFNKLNSQIIQKIILGNNLNEIKKLEIDYSKINFIDGIVWIHSNNNKNREDYMINLLKNIPIKNYKIPEFNPNNNDIIDIFRNIKLDRKLTNNEIARTLSHIKAINFLENIEGDYFLICEDNICLKNTVLINKDLKSIIKLSPKFDILILNKNYPLNIEELYSKWSKYYKPNNNEYIGSTSAYIISREGINKLINFAKFNGKYFNLDKNNLDLSDIYLYKNLDTIVYKYNYIGTKDIEITDVQKQNEDKNNLFQLNIIIKDFHSKK